MGDLADPCTSARISRVTRGDLRRTCVFLNDDLSARTPSSFNRAITDPPQRATVAKNRLLQITRYAKVIQVRDGNRMIEMYHETCRIGERGKPRD